MKDARGKKLANSISEIASTVRSKQFHQRSEPKKKEALRPAMCTTTSITNQPRKERLIAMHKVNARLLLSVRALPAATAASVLLKLRFTSIAMATQFTNVNSKPNKLNQVLSDIRVKSLSGAGSPSKSCTFLALSNLHRVNSKPSPAAGKEMLGRRFTFFSESVELASSAIKFSRIHGESVKEVICTAIEPSAPTLQADGVVRSLRPRRRRCLPLSLLLTRLGWMLGAPALSSISRICAVSPAQSQLRGAPSASQHPLN
mmetsp:Transcript_1541/g.4171  ORF Transcript_1541/g.4171 Transcript_1541/m.4171 type:complete len:259 (-) Transcript_1541:609-1385(-)